MECKYIAFYIWSWLIRLLMWWYIYISINNLPGFPDAALASLNDQVIRKFSRKWVLPCDNSHRIALFSRLTDRKYILCYLYPNLLVYPPICCVGFMIAATAVPSKICLFDERKYCGVLPDIMIHYTRNTVVNTLIYGLHYIHPDLLVYSLDIMRSLHLCAKFWSITILKIRCNPR